jgi:hypothetical protein
VTLKIGLLLATLLAFEIGSAETKPEGFALDKSKAYVYLEFDHVGVRKPLQKGEPRRGLWLRIVNNCQLPIRIGTFGITTGDPGVGILDEVVSEGGGVRTEQNAVLEEMGSGSQTDAPSPPSSIPIPEGYSAEVHSVTTIAPGKNVLFSIPTDHVGLGWFMRVRFTLDLGNPQIGNAPYSYVDFYYSQIPPEYRNR